MASNYYLWRGGGYCGHVWGSLGDAVLLAVRTQPTTPDFGVIVSDEGPEADHDDLVKTYRAGPRVALVTHEGRVELSP